MFTSNGKPAATGMFLVLFCLVTAMDAADSAHPVSKERILESFPMSASDGVLMLPVNISEKRYQFILDTGTTYTALDLPLRSLLGSPVTKGRAKLPIGECELDIYRGPVARIGSIALPSDELSVCCDLDWCRQVSGHCFQGILGNHCLRRLIVRLDFDRNRLDILDRSVARAATWGTSIPFVYDEYGFVRILATVAGARVPFIVDTGSDQTVALAQTTFTNALKAQEIRLTGSMKVGILTGGKQISKGRLSSLTLGPFQHRDLIVSSQDDNYLGLEYFRRYQVVIDFPGESIYLARGKAFDDRDVDDMSGLHILRKQGSIEVDSVDEGSAGDMAGIQPRDRLLIVQDLDASKLQLMQVRRLFRSGNGKAIPLTVGRNGAKIDVILRLKE